MRQTASPIVASQARRPVALCLTGIRTASLSLAIESVSTEQTRFAAVMRSGAWSFSADRKISAERAAVRLSAQRDA